MSTGLVNESAVVVEEEGLFARDFAGQLVRMEEVTAEDYQRDVSLTIDGQRIVVKQAVPTTDSQGNIVTDSQGRTIPRRTTIYDAARELFVKKPGDANPIPILCHQEHLRPVGVCRICVVEISKIKGGQRRRERKLLPACQHRVEEGMEVQTVESPDAEARARVRNSVQLLIELLSADHLRSDDRSPTLRVGQLDSESQATPAPNELAELAGRFGIGSSRFQPRQTDRGSDDSSYVIRVDHNACILCDRCVRACDEVKQNLVIGRTGKGYATHIGFDLDVPMGRSTCVSCGECMISCPTDALTFRATVKPEASAGGESVSAADLRQLPAVRRHPAQVPRWNAGSVVRQRLKAGDVLCKEGEYGATAFILVHGRFQISVRTPLAHVDSQRAKGLWGWLGRISTTATGRDKKSAIRVDGSSPLSYGSPVAERTPEDVILGEMTCMSHYPRSATIVAMEDAEVLEIRRNVLYMLQRNVTSRAILDNVYRERALANHLRGVALFAALPQAERDECFDYLRDKVELVRVDPGQMIFEQGEPADHFYMIRLGFVKVSRNYAGQERVLNYLGPGAYFGEIGMLSQLNDLLGDRVPAGFRGLRTATCSALDDVELVRIRGEHFRELYQRHAAFREKVSQQAAESAEARRGHERHAGPAAGRVPGAGAVQRPEAAGAGPGELHALRRVHQGLRRYARRRHAAGAGRAAVR